MRNKIRIYWSRIKFFIIGLFVKKEVPDIEWNGNIPADAFDGWEEWGEVKRAAEFKQELNFDTSNIMTPAEVLGFPKGTKLSLDQMCQHLGVGKYK